MIGQTYMLTHDEELWEKELPANVETLLSQSRDPLADRSDRGRNLVQDERDKTRVVSYRVHTMRPCRCTTTERRRPGM